MQCLRADEESLVVSLKMPTTERALDAQVAFDEGMMLEERMASHPEVAIQVEVA